MRVRVGVGLVLLIGAGLFGWRLIGGREAPGNPEIVVIRESTLGAPLTAAGCLAISPDGSKIAFISHVEGRRMLAVANIAAVADTGAAATVIPGTEDARHPSWSRDGRRIAFATYERGPLKVADTGNHSISSVTTAGSGGSAWNSKGELLFTAADNGLHRVDASGRSVRVTLPDPGENETEHAWPAFLPDGNRFIYLARAARPSDSRLYLSALDAPHERHVLAEAHSAGLYADGHLLFIYEGILMAQPLNADTGRITGIARPLAVGLHWDEWTGEGAFTANDRGLLAFRLARTPPDLLAWFTIGSMEAQTVAGISDVHEARRSPDGSRIAVTIRDARTGMDDIWIVGREGGEPRRVTWHPASDNSPVWTADGSTLVFRSNRSGIYNVYRAELEGDRDARRLIESTVDDQPTDVSSDGRLLLFNRWSMDTRQDVWALPLTGGAPFAVLETAFLEGNAAFSSDGRWIAYESNDSGAHQVHVRRFPIEPTSIRISLNGGYKPRWTADGRTVIYVRDDNRFEAVDLQIAAGALQPSPPRSLFITRPRLSEPGGFDIDGAGRRILAPSPGTSGTPEPSITFMRGWTRVLMNGSSR